MPSKFKKRQDKMRDKGEADFKAGKPLTAFDDLKNRKSSDRGAYEIGWRAAKDDAQKKAKEECVACEEGIEAVQAADRAAFKKYGWYAHGVPSGSDEHPFGYNYHTHKLDVTFKGALDIQIVFPIDPNLAHSLANEYVDLLKAGKRFKHGDVSSDILKNYDVMFVNAEENGRPLLRMILPDKQNKLAEKEIAAPFDKQWTMLKS